MKVYAFQSTPARDFIRKAFELSRRDNEALTIATCAERLGLF